MKLPEVLIIVASDRASQGVYEDQSGEILKSGFELAGYKVSEKVIVQDSVEEISAAILAGLGRRVGLIVTSGGTGIALSDVTPEATAPFLEKQLPGISEALRAQVRDQLPTANLARGLAGISGKTLIINLAGSPNAARDGLKIILDIAPHVYAQLNFPENSHGSVR